MGYLVDLALSVTDTAIRAEESEIRAWLDQIGECDPAIRANVLRQIATDPSARAYFLRRARGELK